MAGRGDDALPGGYPPAPGSCWMVRSPLPVQVMAEPLGDDGNFKLGDGPIGFFAAARAARTGKKIIVVNAGKGNSSGANWLPGSGTTYYEQCRDRARIALRQPGAFLAGYVMQAGLVEASQVGGEVPWLANWGAFWDAIKVDVGDGPVIGVRYPPTVPDDAPYPSFAAVRAAQLTAPFFDVVVDAPDGPFKDVPNHDFHLDTPANDAEGDLLDGVIP